MKRYSHFLRSALTGALLTGTLLQAAFSYADDTEIFFGGALAEEGILPNVLFLLDDSTSMNCTPTSTSPGCDPQKNSRLEIMKKAFEDIVSETAGVNIGVITFNSSNTNKVLAAVKDIDGSTSGGFSRYGDKLVADVKKISAGGTGRGYTTQYTPIVPTMLEAAKYLRNESNKIITSACQPTHMVLLSAGAANNNRASSPSNLSAIGGSSTACDKKGDETCGREIAKYLSENDQASWIKDANNYVTTHTIGF